MITWSPSSSSALVPTYLRNIQHHASDTHAMHMDHTHGRSDTTEPCFGAIAETARSRTASREGGRRRDRQRGGTAPHTQWGLGVLL